ncbi:hypothetical protein PGIGA_G00233340, partial [Pangasianodon gigas]|nr:hypothetical protein [Pangasianodon gigas]
YESGLKKTQPLEQTDESDGDSSVLSVSSVELPKKPKVHKHMRQTVTTCVREHQKHCGKIHSGTRGCQKGELYESCFSECGNEPIYHCPYSGSS